jgi:hypothetical protein
MTVAAQWCAYSACMFNYCVHGVLLACALYNMHAQYYSLAIL